MQTLTPLLSQNGICPAFIHWLPTMTFTEDMTDVFFSSRPREHLDLFLNKMEANVFTIKAYTMFVLKWFLYRPQTEDIPEMIIGKV